VQSPRCEPHWHWTGVLALAIQIVGWVYYFAALQTPLSG
jgi:hypothetical protein